MKIIEIILFQEWLRGGEYLCKGGWHDLLPRDKCPADHAPHPDQHRGHQQLDQAPQHHQQHDGHTATTSNSNSRPVQNSEPASSQLTKTKRLTHIQCLQHSAPVTENLPVNKWYLSHIKWKTYITLEQVFEKKNFLNVDSNERI